MSINREQDKRLQALQKSAAVWKYKDGSKEELTFVEAAKFWGISEFTRGDLIEARLTALTDLLSEMNRMAMDGEVVLSTGEIVSSVGVRLLMDVDNYLRTKFSRYLDVLKCRRAK
jgi:hypothetical protein